MSLEITGTIKTIYQTQQVTEKFSKREFVVTVKNGNYSDDVCLQFVKDKTDVLDSYKEGDEVKASFNVSSKLFKERWFTNLTCWRLDKVGSAPAQAPTPNTSNPQNVDDLPF